VGRALERRQQRQPAGVIAVSWSAQRRLTATWRRLLAKGKRPTVVAVAVARELAGFCWAITTSQD
jgi:transposase